MRFAIASEGKTDYTVLKNLLYGFFNDKNLPITPLRPKDKEPFGWGNLLKYIATDDFREDCKDENIDYVIVQIDSNECEEWAGVKHIGDDDTLIDAFIATLISELIKRIGSEFYQAYKQRIIFAICVHEIECWLLPFHAPLPAHQGKLVGCVNTLEKIAGKKGYSLNQKNYEDGKHYDELSKEMKRTKDLFQKCALNPGLNLFVNTLKNVFSN